MLTVKEGVIGGEVLEILTKIVDAGTLNCVSSENRDIGVCEKSFVVFGGNQHVKVIHVLISVNQVFVFPTEGGEKSQI